MNEISLDPVERLRLTILMDNVTDPLLADAGPVTRLSWPKALAGGLPTVAAQTTDGNAVPDALIAEPGFSALVRIEKGGRERTLLFDTGVSPTGMVENMRRLGIAPGDVEVIVLSHGHWDHVTGMEGLASALGRVNLPVDPPGVLEPAQDQLSWARRGAAFDQPLGARGDGVRDRRGAPALFRPRRFAPDHR
jgi:7,8-dihydropterin-6-yl-methyl-4-(beta-D-ribofuranosyl)aminobenzene 5'-phosphate synthase